MKRILLMTLVVICSLSLLVHAQSDIDSLKLAAFVNGLITDHLKTKNIAGATISIVKDGKLFLAKGYGFADVENQKPVDAFKTLFRIGSNSKLFVWTSVMQLAEQGKLDLDTDVNNYLMDFKIPASYGKPITLRDLMTHSAGFEDRLIGLFARDSASLKPLGEILKNELPERVRPPGEITSYSNHGTGIAAYIVEQVSGLSFIEYVRKNIMQPLNMNRFSFQQPLPAALKDDMSKGYSFSDGKLKEQKFEYVPLYPVGAGSSSATGLVNFMIAYLQYGRYGDHRILDSTTVVEMQTQQFTHAKGFNGFGLGFIELDKNGLKIIGHGGDTFWFHSALALLPAYDTGIFLGLNTSGGSPADLTYAIIDFMFPEGKTESIMNPEDFTKEDFKAFEGYYRSARYPHSDITKIIALGNSVKLSYDNGNLVSNAMGKSTNWIRTGEVTFREKDGIDKLAFRRAENNKTEYLFLNSLPFFAFEKVPVIDTPAVQYGILILCLATFFITIIYWPLAWKIRRRYLIKTADEKVLQAKIKIPAWTSSLVFLIFLFWLVSSLANPLDIVYAIPVSLKADLFLPVVNIILILITIYYNRAVWKNSNYNVITKIHYSLLTFVLILFEWELYHWNLLGWNY